MRIVASLKWIIIIIVVSIAAMAAGIAVYSSQPSADEPERMAGEEERGTEAVVSESQNKSSAVVTPNPYAKEFPLTKDTWPNGILVDSKGIIWTVGSKSHALIAFDPEQKKAKSYPLPSGSGDDSQFTMVWTMAEGKDGSIWFSGSGRNPLWRFDSQTEKFEVIDSLSAAPMQMKVDGEGRIWYTVLQRGVIGAVQKQGQGYDVKELELGKESFPSGVFVQNQTLWITLSVDGKIALFHIPSEAGREVVDNVTNVAQFPRQEMLVSPTDIILQNGSAWVTEHNTSFLTKYDTKTHQITRYPTALHPLHVVTLPYWLEPAGQEGIWFNEHRGNRIAFFDFSDNTLTEYEIPTRNPEMGDIANVLTISADPVDASKVWFTEFTEDKIGYVDRSVPIPFDIRIASEKQIVLENGQTAQIAIEIVRNPSVELFNNTLSFGVSSSAVLSGVLLNATATFSPSLIDLSKTDSTQTVTLELADKGMQKGEHVLALSATDGAVVRTAYMKLVVK